jgi:predicted nucleotidyltransferase
MINQTILKRIDHHMRAAFATDEEVTDIYRFGSTIKRTVKPEMDIDYLFVNTKSQRREYILKLEQLCHFFNSSQVYSATFDTTSTTFKRKIGRLITKLISEFPDVVLLPRYCFGPFPRHLDIGENGVYLHLAGPLSNSEFHRFLELFPVFSLNIIKNHLVVLGNNPEIYLKRLNVSTRNIADAIAVIIQRCLSLDDIKSKNSCVRRVVMLTEMLNNGKSHDLLQSVADLEKCHNQTELNAGFREVLLQLQKPI